MQNALTIGKRSFTIAVAAATILWSVGFAALALPQTGSAADLSSGDLIKGSLTTVYYYYDGERWTFPTSGAYFTWYENFDDVETISDADLASIPLAGNIVRRPGSGMIKITSDAKSYVVGRDGEIRWAETEAVATDLFGSDWADWISDVEDVFFVDYTEGASMMSAEFVDGMLVEGSTYLIWDGFKRLVTDDGMSANRLMSDKIITDSSVDLGGHSDGDTIDGEVPAVSDTSQQATSEVVAEGDLTVELSDDQPDSTTVPEGASGVEFLSLDLSSDGPINVTNFVFDFSGISDTDVIDEVFLYWGEDRLTDGRSINSSTRQATFSGVDVDVDGAPEAPLRLLGDVSGALTGTSTAGFCLESDGVTSTAASVGGDFDLCGPLHTLTDAASVGTITIDATGSISDPTIGESEAEICMFNLDASGEDALIDMITLDIDDAGDHSGYELWQGTTSLGSCDAIGGDLVRCGLDEGSYALEDGSDRNFAVTAAIGGDSGDDIKCALEEETDLSAVGGDFGFGMTVDFTGYDEAGGSCLSSADDCSFSSIEGGRLTFAFNGPSADDIEIGGNGVSILDFTITAENLTTIKEFEIDITMSNPDDGATCANFTDFSVVKQSGGTTLMGPEEIAIAGGSPQGLMFTDDFSMEPGEQLALSLEIDVEDGCDAVDADTISATIDMSTVDADDANGDALVPGTDIIPSADLAGHDQTLTDSSLDVELSSTPSSGTYVKGVQGIDVVGFNFEAGDASGVTVTDMTFDVIVEGDPGEEVYAASGGDFEPEDFVSSCSLYDSNDVLIDGPESVATDGELLFDGFDWDLPPGDTDKGVVNCNFANVDVDGADDDKYAWELTAVTAEDDDGDSITATLGETNDDDGDDPDTIITITDVGSLTVEVAPDTPDAMILIGSSSDVEVTVFRFSASDEAFRVERITLDNTCASLVCNDNIATAVNLTYEDCDGDTQTDTSFLSAGGVEFDNLDLCVDTVDDAEAAVSVDSNSVSSTGATSGEGLQLNFDSSAAAEFEAVGIASGESLDGTDVPDLDEADGVNEHVARKTAPTLTLSSGSPSGSSVPGLDEVFRFNVAADSHGFVQLDEFTFDLVTTDNGASSWNICDGGTTGEITESDLSFFQVGNSSELEAGDGDWTLLADDGTVCSTDVDVVELLQPRSHFTGRSFRW